MARQFTASLSEKVQTAAGAITRGTGHEVTGSCWFYLDSLPASAAWVFCHNSASGGYWGMVVLSTGVLRSQYAPNGRPAVIAPTAAGAIVAGRWYHAVAVVGQNAGSDTRIYVDGVQKGSIDSTENLPDPTVLAAGADPLATSYVNGRIAELGIWSSTVALNAQEIRLLSQGAKPSQVKGGELILYWPMDGRQGVERDLSGFSRHGNLTGTRWGPDPPQLRSGGIQRTKRYFVPGAATPPATTRRSGRVFVFG